MLDVDRFEVSRFVVVGLESESHTQYFTLVCVPERDGNNTSVSCCILIHIVCVNGSGRRWSLYTVHMS